jgi:hypothetical protein
VKDVSAGDKSAIENQHSEIMRQNQKMPVRAMDFRFAIAD